MQQPYIKISVEDISEIKEELINAERWVDRILTAQLEEDLSPCDFEYNMQGVCSWLDDKQTQIQKLIDDSNSEVD